LLRSDAKVSIAKDTLDIISSFVSRANEFERREAQTTADTELGILETRYNNEIARAGENSDLVKAIDKQYAADKLEITDKLAVEERKIARDQAIADKAFALFNIAINTAVATIKVLASTGNPWLAAAAVVSGVAAGVGVASEPLPALATGGIVTPQAGGVPVTVAEAGQPEVIFPLDKLDSFLSTRSTGNANTGGGFGGSSQPIRIQLNNQQWIDGVITTVADAISDQTLNLDAVPMGA